jgi:hypothetical protein
MSDQQRIKDLEDALAAANLRATLAERRLNSRGVWLIEYRPDQNMPWVADSTECPLPNQRAAEVAITGLQPEYTSLEFRAVKYVRAGRLYRAHEERGE